MDTQEFFKLFEGQWVSQRTLHHINTEQTEAAKAELWIEIVPADSVQISKACESFDLAPDKVFLPMEITYQATLANGLKQLVSTLMIPVSTSDTSGKLINIPQSGDAFLGEYSLGSDDVMTFTNQKGTNTLVERIWYASENLRVRSITQSTESGPSEANFCSEIRKMGASQPKPTQEQAQQNLSPLAAWRARQAQS